MSLGKNGAYISKSDLIKLSFIVQMLANARNSMPRFVIVLDKQVDQNKLFQAINDAIKVHPLFKYKLVKKGFAYYYSANDNPIVLKKNNYKYGENGYPWTITYNDKTIIFTCMHFFTDGVGTSNFLSSILKSYFGKPETGYFDLSLDDALNNTCKVKYSKMNYEPKRLHKFLIQYFLMAIFINLYLVRVIYEILLKVIKL